MNSLNSVHSTDAFRIILERERARSDRTGQFFSLIIFSINEENGRDESSLNRLGSILAQKVRMSDEVGWYDGKRIGAILPGTSTEGAQHFTDIVKGKIKDVAPRLNCTIYSYPSSGIKTYIPKKDANEITAPINTEKPIEQLEILFSRPIPIWKRLIDFSLALFLLIILSPLFAFVAIFIKIVSPGPVFYRQERIGFQRRQFTFWKFRTMHVNNDSTVHKQYLAHLIESNDSMTKLDDGNDHRIIPFGRFLRSSCIDELPQLINVLLGDMSLIGPRPCLPYEAENFLQWHTRRFDVVPGMTGLWQVSGKNRMTFREMIRLDIRYSRKMSPWQDAKILFLTGPAIFESVGYPLFQETSAGQKSKFTTSSRRREPVRG